MFRNWEIEQQCKRCLRDFLLGTLLPCIVFIAILTFNGHEITVDPHDGSVIAIESSWWGIIQKEKEIKWMKTRNYDYPGWMTKDKKGQWYLYISE